MRSSNSIVTRRDALRVGGLALAGLASGLAGRLALAESVVEIRMHSHDGGAHVGFDPVGLLIDPGTTVRWIVEADVHTTTAYHPANDAHALRIPEAAEPWNSDYLLPDQSFSIVLSVPGVYDYYCVPHEHAGMVGRIVVSDGSQPISEPPAGGAPEEAEKVFPSVEDIVRAGRVSLR